MPEVIDGFSYETTPVIPASTNTPAGGARPFPSAASPGRAFWQLLKRYAQELDKFESGPFRTLTDRIVGVEKAVSNTTVARRLFTFDGTLTSSGVGFYRVPLTADGPAADPGEPADSTKGISYSSPGLLTLREAGLYLFTVSGFQAGNSNSAGQLVIRRVDNSAVIGASKYDSGYSFRDYTVAAVIPANTQIEVVAYSATSTANTNIITGFGSAFVAGRVRTQLTVSRLSA